MSGKSISIITLTVLAFCLHVFGRGIDINKTKPLFANSDKCNRIFGKGFQDCQWKQQHCVYDKDDARGYYCVDQCNKDHGEGFQDCHERRMNCMYDQDDSKGYRCVDKCKNKYREGYKDCHGKQQFCTYDEKDPKGYRCVDPCMRIVSGDESGKDICGKENSVCGVNEDRKSYKCTKCEDHEIVHENKCVDPCIKIISGDESGKDICGKENSVCGVNEKRKSYKCTKCYDHEIVHENKCVVNPCYDGMNSNEAEMTWHDYCKVINAKCIVKRDEATCQCNEEHKLFDVTEKECKEYCANKTKTKEECNHLNRICRSLTHYPFYTCGQCKDGYTENENQCVDYCATGQEGKRMCNVVHKTCEAIVTPPFYFCNKCHDGFEENNDVCIGVCKNNSRSGTKCRNLNRKCEYIHDFPFYHCGECQDGLQEIAGLCVQTKSLKEVDPLQLLLISSKKASEENKILLYKPKANNTLFDIASVLNLK